MDTLHLVKPDSGHLPVVFRTEGVAPRAELARAALAALVPSMDTVVSCCALKVVSSMGGGSAGLSPHKLQL